MGPTVTEKKKYTYEDYLKTPEDERYEIIEGQLLNDTDIFTTHQSFIYATFRFNNVVFSGIMKINKQGWIKGESLRQ